jgi:hypothetical protein
MNDRRNCLVALGAVLLASGLAVLAFFALLAYGIGQWGSTK